MGGDTYSFRKVTPADLGILAQWQAHPHVSAWWDSDDPYCADDLHDPKVARWIVSHGDRPFAFMQDYTVHGWDQHHFSAQPTGTRGIDQFVGDPAMLGRGHGTGMIRHRMHALFAAGAPVIVTDPHPDNARAIAVYHKLGFVPFGPPQDTQWGVILPMRATRVIARPRT